MRIDTQKQTLTARDESIKKMLEMLQNKGEGISIIIFSNSLTKRWNSLMGQNPNFSFLFFGENQLILVCRQGGRGASSPAHADGRSETGSYDLNQKNLVQ